MFGLSATAIAAIGVGVAVVGTAAAVTGTVMAANAAADTADYNAKVSEQNALAAQDKAAYDENIHRDSVRKLLSSQRALYGKSGVDMTGSPLLALEDTTGKGELDALAIRHGGSVEAAQQRSSAALSKMQGKNAKTAGYFQAGSSLLSGASATMKAAK